MDRRTLIGMVAGGLLTIRLAAYARPSGRVYRLGILRLGTRPTSDPILANWLTKPCASWATSKARTSSLRGDTPTTRASGFPGLRASWCSSRMS